MSRMSKFINKIDFSSNPSLIPDTDEGNLKLYYELSLIRDSYDSKSRDNTTGISKTFEEHITYYLSVMKEMESRKLSIPHREKSAIEKAISKSMKEVAVSESSTALSSKPSYYCVHCGNKLTEKGMIEKECEDCYGRQPGWSLLHGEIKKPFADYKDFDDCVARNSDKGDPKAYCATIQRNTEKGQEFLKSESELLKEVEKELHRRGEL